MSQKKRHQLFLYAIALGLLHSARAFAQPLPPFYGGPVTVFDIEVEIIDSGTLLDAQATVSHDQRYVTINAQVANSTVVALQQFRTQAVKTGAGPGSGFVGGVSLLGEGGQAVSRTLPSAIDRADRNAISVLNQRGVHLVAPLK
jgi:hypothetical protein